MKKDIETRLAKLEARPIAKEEGGWCCGCGCLVVVLVFFFWKDILLLLAIWDLSDDA